MELFDRLAIPVVSISHNSFSIADVDHAGKALAFVHRVGDHPFETRAGADRVERVRVRDAVGARVVAVVEDDVLALQLPLDADLACRLLRDPQHLGVRLFGSGRGVLGQTNQPDGTGVEGIGLATGFSKGVRGESSSGVGIGTWPASTPEA